MKHYLQKEKNTSTINEKTTTRPHEILKFKLTKSLDTLSLIIPLYLEHEHYASAVTNSEI